MTRPAPTAPAQTGPALTVAVVSDRGMFLPSLRAVDGVLRRAGPGVDVLFAGLGLTDAMWGMVDRVAAAHPAARIDARPLPPDWLAEARSPKSFITPTALGRLFLPRLVPSGRVLYLDGDVMVTGDLALALDLDMAGQPLAGVRDFSVMKWTVAGAPHPGLQRQIDAMPDGMPMTDYINSGVLLMDMDAIHAIPGLTDAMADMVAARGFPTVDQDRINILFRDRIVHLDPAWNCSWGRLAQQRRHQAGLPVTGVQPAPMILHFHGPRKPWQPLRLSTLSRGARAIWRYRKEMAAFHRRYPSIPQALPE